MDFNGNFTIRPRMTVLSKEEIEHLESLHLLTDKHMLYIANVDDKGLKGNEYSKIVEEIAGKEGEESIIISAEIEWELALLEPEEEKEFLEEFGIDEPGLDKLIHTAYHLLGLITFFTFNEKELRAWTIHKGTKAPQAAGVVHTDFEKGFIRAETVSYEDLLAAGNMVAAKEAGKVRLEGKEYVVRDGDVMHFRFNV